VFIVVGKQKVSKKFSIITSCYNSAPFLSTYFKSIIDQKYRPLELVFVNDHSTDDFSRVIKKYISRLQKNKIEVKYIFNEHRRYCGSSYAKAINAASGDFFGVLDSDDTLTNNAVSYIMLLYKKFTETSWIYSQFRINDQKMKPRKRGFCIAPPKGKTLLWLGKNGKHGFSHWRTFSRRVPNYLSVFPEKRKSAIDKYMGYKLEELAPGMFVNKILYEYRQRTHHSISTSERTRITWREMMIEAAERRKLHNIKVFPIKVFKD